MASLHPCLVNAHFLRPWHSQLHLCQASPYKEHWNLSTASNQPDSPMQPRGPWPNGRVANAYLARDFESNPRSHLSENMRQLLSTYMKTVGTWEDKIWFVENIRVPGHCVRGHQDEGARGHCVWSKLKQKM